MWVGADGDKEADGCRKKKNCTIDVMRLVYIMIIVFFHFYETTHEHFVLGWLAVSMFLVISGLFLFEHLEKAREFHIYICKRIKRFFAYTAIATILIYVSNVAGAVYIDHVVDFTSDITLPELALDIFSIGTQKVMSGAFPYLPTEWTIAAILIVESTIYVLWASLNEKTRGMIVPAFVLISLFLLINEAKHTMLYQAAAAICLGYLALKGSQIIKDLNLNQKGRAWLTAFEILCNMMVICILTFAEDPCFYLLCLPVFVVIVSISYSGVSYVEELLKKLKVTKYCGEFSLDIYLTHWIPQTTFLRLYTDPYERYSHKFEFLLAVLITGAIYCVLVRLVIKLCGKLKKACENALLDKVKETF